MSIPATLEAENTRNGKECSKYVLLSCT